MIDVNEITSTLRGMPDQQLQQYAAMHKGDPYILSLAVAESNQRKKLRTAAQGQAGAQPMPKVADAAIAGMTPQQLPENQGIAQIPTPNVQNMADGGIAGYGDDANEGMADGGMFDFAQRSEPVLRMAGGGHIPRYQGNTIDGSVVRSNPLFNVPGMVAVQPRASFTQAGAPENQTVWEQISGSLQKEGVQRQLQIIEDRIARGIAGPEEKAYYEQLKAKAAGKPLTVTPKDVVNPDEVAMAAEKAGRFKASADKTTDKTSDKPPSAAPVPQATLPTGGMSVKQAQDLGGKFYDLKGATGRIEQQLAQERQDIANEKEARAEKLAAFNKAQGPAMAGYEKLLKGEEMQDATDKEKAGLMALFKGFLGMAAGESPNAAVNIAKGAMVGLGDYSDALKEFKKSAKERNKAMAEIENARRLEAKGDLKDSQAAEDKANDYLRASQRHGIDAIMNATGKSAEISAGLYKSAAEIASANARANAQLTAPSAQMQLFNALGKGDIEKGLGVYANVMGPEAKGDQAIIAKYSGPQGQIALQMLEASGPEGKAQAQIIKQIIKQNTGAMLKPTNAPTGQVLVGQ